MSLEICLATPADAPRIAEIHMAAFADNAMLLAQFPTLAVRKALQKSIEMKALVDIDDPQISVLIVKDSQRQSKSDREIIAFAKLTLPVPKGETYTESPWIWPEGTDHDVLAAWTRKTEAAEERVLGGNPCYRLTFIGTDPHHERRGAGSLLVKWIKERSAPTRIPLYLESTLEAAPLYTRHGFVTREEVSLQLPRTTNGQPDIYKEIIFTFDSTRV
ncbi:putative GNAT family acetyltransferase [Hypomontagnella monticulosa]|nr:putative GNAT family acetyltransferase [Hypomontagnella monticulosa]